MKKRWLLLVFLFQCFVLTVQSQPALDTIKDCLTKKPKFYFSFDSRNSFIDHSRAKIFGFLMGMNYANRLYCAVGYNQLYPPTSNFDETYYYMNADNKRDSVKQELKLYYVSASVDYVFYKSHHWSLSMPLQIGIGTNYYRYNQGGTTHRLGQQINIVYEPAVAVEYKLCRYFGVGAEMGYRFMVGSDRKLNAKFTSPIYAFSFILYYFDIYKRFIKRE